MTSVRNNTSASNKSKPANPRLSLNTKGLQSTPGKSSFSPMLKKESDSSQLARKSSSKKFRVMKDEVLEDFNEIELLKNKLDKLPTNRVYYKTFDCEEQSRINKQIKKFLNTSDNNDNNAPLLNKLKLIRNCSLPFITLNNVDLSVLKPSLPIMDLTPRNGRNSIPTRNLSNSFDYINFNFNKKKISFPHTNTINLVVHQHEIYKQAEESKANLDESDDSELKHFLDDLKENNKDNFTTVETKTTKPSENEAKTLEQSQDSLLELEHFLLESGLTPVREPKPSSSTRATEEKKTTIGDILQIPEIPINDKVNETYTTNMSKKKVSFVDSKTIIKYEKKGDVKVYYIFNEDDVMLRKVNNCVKRFSAKDKNEKIKSILIKKNKENKETETPSTPKVKEAPPVERKKLGSVNIKLKNVKSRFLDEHYNSKYKKPPQLPKEKAQSLSKNSSFLTIPKTNKFINKNINYINQLAEKKKQKEALQKNKKPDLYSRLGKRTTSAICKRFTGNPIKFYTKIPPVIELETLRLDSTFITSYKHLTESLLLNNSVQSIGRGDLLSSFKNDDNTLITDPLNFEIGENMSILNLNNSMDDRYHRKITDSTKRSCDRSEKSVNVISHFYTN